MCKHRNNIVSKLIQKTTQVTLEEIQKAITELRSCHEEIRKGLTAKVYEIGRAHV